MTTDSRPMGRKIQARVFRVVNVPMRFVLGLPFATPPGSRLMLISFTGRRTGKSYRQPVSYVRDADGLLTFGGGRWTLNLTNGAPITIRLKGRDLSARPELVTDPAEVERLLKLMTKKNPGARRFVRIPSDSNGNFDQASLHAAIEHGFCIVRWHLNDGSSASGSREDSPR
jgi:deazaflavin-dependent oxidoreductase (nitroreductase family)